jgi:ligand-binding sensor domain-containing protein
MSLLEDRQGNLWVGTYADGVYRVTGDTVAHFTTPDGLPNELVILPRCQDQAGHIWFGVDDPFGTRTTGLISFKDGRFGPYTTSPGLSGTNVRAIFQDRVGTIWIGTNAAGFVFWLGKLNFYNGDPFQAEMVRSFILAPEYHLRFGQ